MTWLSKLSVAVVVSGLATSGYADSVLGLYGGAGAWSQETSGEVVSETIAVDVQQDLGLEEQTNRFYYAGAEHGIPVLPNFRSQYSELSSSGRNQLSDSIEFNGSPFPVDTDVSTDVDLIQADAVLYYQVLDSALSLDLGVGARYVEGQMRVASASTSSKADFESVLPLLYSRLRADLPFSGFWIGAEALALTHDGDHLYDTNAQVGWDSALGIGAELGWRTFRMDVDAFDRVDAADVNINGLYAALNFHF